MAIESLIQPVISRTRYRIQTLPNGSLVFKAIISHPMETGKRKDRHTGKIIPADYIDKLIVSFDGEVFFEAKMGTGTSKNPFISFVITKPVLNGQSLTIDVIDNKGKKMSIINTIAFDEHGRFDFIDKEYRVDDVVYPICRNPSGTQ